MRRTKPMKKKSKVAGQSFEHLVRGFVGSRKFSKLDPSERKTVREISDLQEKLSKHYTPEQEEEKLIL